MHIAILMTNTDESDFAQRHPKDGEKFSNLMHLVRPDWDMSVYSVKDGVFPEDWQKYDGFMITGSPASVRDTDDWVQQLLELIRDIYASGTPMFGACFGHQAIALALGGEIGDNPDGWEFGLCERDVVAHKPWTLGMGDTQIQYGAHIEQVVKAPEGAEVLVSAPAVPNAGFAIGDTVYTTQNHPEMTPDFAAALVEEYAEKLPADVAKRAQNSLAREAETKAYAETIARFFEHATQSTTADP